MTIDSLTLGGGTIANADGITRYAIPPTLQLVYANAQHYDYRGRRRSNFTNRPPLSFTLMARFSHPADELGGTAGFGFWNNPLTLTGGGFLAAPNALWFFASSPPNDQYLCQGVPGRGWKAASLRTVRGLLPNLAFLPAAALASALAQLPLMGKPIMAVARRAISAHEKLIGADMRQWHQYSIEWREREAVFMVDTQEILRAPSPPALPLGFVAWIDNQYAIVSEAGKFAFGLVVHPESRWMEIQDLRITHGVQP